MNSSSGKMNSSTSGSARFSLINLDTNRAKTLYDEEVQKDLL